MSEYTPTTEEIIRSYTIPDHVTHPRRDGESLGQYLSRISIEGHASQVESEAAAHRWLSEHDRQVAERAWDQAYMDGRQDERTHIELFDADPHHAPNRVNPHRRKEQS